MTDQLLRQFNLIPHVTKKTVHLIGETINRLTILAIGKPKNSYRYTAVCSCLCGKGPFPVRLDKVTASLTQSCGCYHIDVITTHGSWRSPLYTVWNNMVSRCTNSSDKSFLRYGGRGITVCDRWLNVENFISDMLPTFKEGLQIERIDNDGPYSPSNCCWKTAAEQQRNKRSNIRITINGETKVLAEWCREYGANYFLVRERINRGWDPVRALTQPVGH